VEEELNIEHSTSNKIAARSVPGTLNAYQKVGWNSGNYLDEAAER